MNNSSSNNNNNFYNSSPSAYNSQYKPQPQPQSNQFNNGKPCFEKKESEKKRNESESRGFIPNASYNQMNMQQNDNQQYPHYYNGNNNGNCNSYNNCNNMNASQSEFVNKETKKIKISKCSAIISFVISMILVVLMLCSKFEIGIAMVVAVIAFVLSIIGMINGSKEGMAIAGFLISFAYVGCFIMAHLIDVFFG